MIQKFILAVAIFLIILLALSFGETAFAVFFSWLTWISCSAIHSFSELYHHVVAYAQANALKVVIALALTIPISYWISRRHKSASPSTLSKRKLSIVLAIFLGWIGIHRFYIGQYFVGLLYIVLFVIFLLPLPCSLL